MPNITHVRYSALFSTGSYENEKIGFTAQLTEGESPEEVIEALREKTYSLANNQEEYNTLLNRRRELRELEGKIEAARQNFEEVMTFLKTQGLKTETAPFPTLLKAIAAPLEEHVSTTDVEIVDDEEAGDAYSERFRRSRF